MVFGGASEAAGGPLVEMKPLSQILQKPYMQYGCFFCAGAALEVFMNFFHIGQANIYRSILKNLSDSRAQERFQVEKQLYETINSEDLEEV